MDHFLPNDDLDRDLVRRAQNGEQDALDQLVRRHQSWVLHIAQRMLWNRAEAEDAVQEILIKAITHLSEFRHRSGFRTWLYRIAGNHLLDRCRSARTFASIARGLDEIPDEQLPDPNSSRMETALLVEEAKIACTTGILLCLEPRQRLAFIVGEILGIKDDAGSTILDTTPSNFRQILSRARRDLYHFLNGKCGLVNQANPCRCAKKTRGFIERGWVNPKGLQFVSERLVEVREVAENRFHELEELERRHAEIFRAEPLLKPEKQAADFRKLLRETGLEGALNQ